MKKLLALLPISLFLLLATSCEKEKNDALLTLAFDTATLNHKDTLRIEASSEDPIKYAVESPYHASISNDGVITAGYVGETNILLDNGSNTATFKLVVEPRYTFIETPYLIWGASKEDLLVKYRGHDFYTNEEETLLMSYTINTEPVIKTFFSFGSNDFLAETALFIRYSHYSMTHKFLLERYPFVSTITGEDGNYIHLYSDALNEEDETMAIVFFEVNEEYFIVTYLPVVGQIEAKGTSKSQLKSARIEKVMQFAKDIKLTKTIH